MLPTITVDVGTTSVKLCLFDAAGTLRASARRDTPTVHDAWGEIYDVDALVGALTGFVAELSPADRAIVERIAITGVGESGGLVRADGSLASPLILWHDHRGAAYLDALDADQRALVYRRAGLPVNANYGLSKVAWALAQATDAADAQWLNVAEFLAAYLTGRRWSEFSLASRTSVLDLTTGRWSAELAALVGVDIAVFPELRRAIDGSPLTTDAARSLDLDPAVRVHVAGHDHMVGAVGAGLRRGELLNSTGTTEGLLFLRDRPVLDESAEHAKLANGISCTASDFTLFASIPTGGSAFATLRGLLGIDGDELSGVVDAAYERYMEGGLDPADAPLVLPRFRGSPPPVKRKADRGTIAGLRTDTTREELVFGTFLGLVLQFRDVLDLFPDAVEGAKVIGPASRNRLWLQLKSDLLGMPLGVSRFPEVVSRGAQALASDAASGWDDTDPWEVVPGDDRHARLTAWADDVRPTWEYLKGIPS